MSLLEEIKKLRELEQAGTKNVLSWKMLDHAPVMLEVLGCFQEGDVERLRKGDYSVVQRMIYAAGLMEQER